MNSSQIKSNNSRYFWLYGSFLSAILLILSFHNPKYSFLAWVSLAPIFIIIIKEKPKKIFISSIIVSLIFNVFYLIWMKEYKHPLSLPGVVFAETIYFCLAVILTKILSANLDFLGEIRFPVAWLCIDYLKTIGFLAFPWGILGYSQYKNLVLIQSASIFGVWGITFLIVYFNAIVASIIYQIIKKGKVERKTLVNISAMTMFLVLSLIFGYVMLKEQKRNDYNLKRVALIQANFNPWSVNINENIEKEIELTKKSLFFNPDLIVWSESSAPFPYEYWLRKNNRYALRIDRFISSTKKPFIIGSIEFNGEYFNHKFLGDFFNVAIYYDNGRLRNVYRKIHLVPFGEWFPYKKLFPFVAKILEKAGAGDFTPGDDYIVFNSEEFNFNVLICFEDVIGDLARKFVKKGSDLLVNVTNDAWTGSKKAEIQHFSISIFRAIENRRSLVRAANGGVTAIVDPYGKVLKSLKLFKSDFLIGDVPIVSNHITFYTKAGNLLPRIILIVAFIMLIYSSKRNNM